MVGLPRPAHRKWKEAGFRKKDITSVFGKERCFYEQNAKRTQAKKDAVQKMRFG